MEGFWRAVNLKLAKQTFSSRERNLIFLLLLLEFVAIADERGACSGSWGDCREEHNRQYWAGTTPERAEMFNAMMLRCLFPNASSVTGADCPLKDASSRRISKLTVKVREAV